MIRQFASSCLAHGASIIFCSSALEMGPILFTAVHQKHRLCWLKINGIICFYSSYEGKSPWNIQYLWKLQYSIKLYFPSKPPTEITTIQFNCGFIFREQFKLESAICTYWFFIYSTWSNMIILNVSGCITVCLQFWTVYGWEAKWFLFHLLLSWWPWTLHIHTHTHTHTHTPINREAAI